MAWVHTHVLNVPKLPCRYNIYCIADLQIGSKDTNKQLIKNWVKRIAADPYGLYLIKGDIEDDDRPSTRVLRRAAFAERPEVPKSDSKKHILYIENEVLPLLAPLAQSKLGSLGVLAGHHWTDLGELNSTQYICNRLSSMGKNKVPYLGQMSAWIKLIFHVDGMVRKSIKKELHIQHGVGGGKTMAAALNALKKTSEGFHADVYLRAHDCSLVAGKFDVMGTTESETPGIKRRTITLMNVGSATEGYDLSIKDPCYPEMGMMNPKSMGWGILHADIFRQSRSVDPSNNLEVNFTAEI